MIALMIPNIIPFPYADFEVVYNDWMLNKLDVAAHVSSVDEKIYLPSNRSDRQKFALLMHEIVHCANHETGEEMTESQVLGVATLVTHVLTGMGIKPDFSLIKNDSRA
ncbi:MAG: hypothetical protein KKD44_27065 [Proteobacteria bacterium]|nr:hypothetical protein [Pseudomonadota bacterium]